LGRHRARAAGDRTADGRSAHWRCRLATALGRELAKASNGMALADIAAPVEKKLRRIAGHEFRAFGIAWTMAQNRWRDGRD